MMRASDESPRMFESDFIDFFSRTPWWSVPLLWIPATLAFFAVGMVRGTDLLVALGLWAVGFVAWTLTEYSLHRTLFHWVPDTSWGERFHFFLHGVHHKWVFDRYRLVMPPAVSLGLAVVFGGLFRLTMGPIWMWPFFSGFVFGYCVYDCMHYLQHHSRIKWKWFLRLKAHHMSHHHNKKYQELRFGVSTRVWDYVFGTVEPKAAGPQAAGREQAERA
ncbi:MAG: sterol desaturase family protein [Alphaproteobacteria bacterium]|nr:sterol desaturase family protein [Alphaproteobacteria bacterium]